MNKLSLLVKFLKRRQFFALKKLTIFKIKLVMFRSIFFCPYTSNKTLKVGGLNTENHNFNGRKTKKLLTIRIGRNTWDTLYFGRSISP